jgi:hypothetical protein
VPSHPSDHQKVAPVFFAIEAKKLPVLPPSGGTFDGQPNAPASRLQVTGRRTGFSAPNKEHGEGRKGDACYAVTEPKDAAQFVTAAPPPFRFTPKGGSR